MVIKKLKKDKNNNSERFFKAIDITPKDDMFHGSMNIVDIEWWYFDALFDNNYSVHVGVRVYHVKNIGLVQYRFNIYKDGKVVAEKMQWDLFSKFVSSSDIPMIFIGGKKIIEFDQDRYTKTGELSYTVSMQIDDYGMNLKFIGTTKGWKIETPDTSWAVALPKAVVAGTLTMNGEVIHVKGIGYHDHNWDYSLTTAMNNFGWFWGKIFGDTINVIWANTMEVPGKNNLISIVNIDGKDNLDQSKFFNINPRFIIFNPKNFILNHRRRIPTHFDIQIKNVVSGDDVPIDIDVTMDAYEIHYDRIFTISYWRYHVYCSGKLSVGSTTEILDNRIQIIELLRFKS